MQRIIILFVLILLALYEFVSHRSIHRADGWTVVTEPEQILFKNPQPSFEFKETSITKLADYKIKARVLSTEKYWLGKMAEIAPIDVAVGWKEMSDSKTLEKLTISQADRFYFYEWKSKDLIDPKRVAQSSANMHLIAANLWIKDEIKKLRAGHIITLTGQLVNVRLSDGQEIKTSLTRDDTGPGACEIMWVTNIDMLD